MNVTSGMYPLRPIFELDQKITLPTCMYHMKNLHVANGPQPTAATSDNSKSNPILNNILQQESSPDIAVLESQQEDILKKLATLKEQIEHFRQQLSQPLKREVNAAVTNICIPTLCKGGDVDDLVIYANPNNPPYGLLALKILYGDSLGQIYISSHVHSSLTKPVPQNILLAFNQNTTKQRGQLHVTLVWKDVGQHLQLLVSPTRHTVLYGEVNMIRLLSRLSSSSYDMSNVEEASTIDWALDCIHQLSQGSAPRRDLNAMLMRFVPGPSGWLLAKSNPTIVDAALWSYFKSKGAAECPTKLKNWIDKCNKLFLN